MLRLLASVSCVVVVVLGAPQAVYPPGLDPATCPNFPYCGPTPAEIPQVPGAAAVIAAQQAVLAQEAALRAPVVPQVPGAAAVIAAQQAVLAQEAALRAPVVPQVPGLAAHAAAEAQVRQAQAAVATAFTGLVGPSGNIGPSGLCGPSGCIAF
jgi:hypothetical protein